MCALIYIECTTLDLLQYGLCQVQCESREISDLQWRQPEVFGYEFGSHPKVPRKYLDPSLFLQKRVEDLVHLKGKFRWGRFSKGDPILSLTKGSDSSWKERRHKRLVCLVRLTWSCVLHVKEKRSFAAFVLLRYSLLYRLRVFIDHFMLIALSIWCLLFLFSF